MGGKKEAVLDRPVGSGSEVTTKSGIRIHESNGEVHFHDDMNGLKVAIPVVDFYARWNRFKLNGFSGECLTFVDINNKAKIHIGAGIRSDKTPNSISLYVRLEKVQLDDNFVKIEQLVYGT